MKKFVTWKCDICEAVFEFDADLVPLRCPDCLSMHEHLTRIDDEVYIIDPEDDDTE